MLWLDFIIAAIMAGIAAAIIVSIAARRRDVVWPGFWFYFVILTLGFWVARLWIEPTVWRSYGWHLLLVAAIGAVIAFALVTTLLPRRVGYGQVKPTLEPGASLNMPDAVITAEHGVVAPELAMSTYSVVFWVLVVGLVGAVIAGLIIAVPTP